MISTDASEPSAFLGAHRCYATHEGGPSLVLKVFFQLLGRIESGVVLWDLLE